MATRSRSRLMVPFYEREAWDRKQNDARAAAAIRQSQKAYMEQMALYENSADGKQAGDFKNWVDMRVKRAT